MGLYSAAIVDASVGATSETFDPINTTPSTGQVTLRADARRLIGFWFVGTPVARTVDEAQGGILRVKSKSLGIVDAEWDVDGIHGSIGTNNAVQTVLPHFFGLDYALKGSEIIEPSFSTGGRADITDAWSVAFGVAYLAGNSPDPPEDWVKWWPHYIPTHKFGYSVRETAVITTAAEQQIGGDIAFDSGVYGEIVGYKANVLLDDASPTAGDEVVGFMRLKTAIPDYEPQEWPLPALSAPFGTEVGMHVAFNMGYKPMYIRGTGKTERVQLFSVLNAAVTSGIALKAALAVR